MHARELVDLAALIALQAPVLVQGEGTIPQQGIEDYWVASKCRLDRWTRELKRLSIEAAGPRNAVGHASRSLLAGLIEEVLAGEVLTRVWTAAMCAYDRMRGTAVVEPVARSVLLGNMEARHRVLKLLVSGSVLAPEEGLRLNQVRCRTERWTDVLVAYLARYLDVSEFAFDPSRARDFADDLSHQAAEQGGRFIAPLVMGALQAAFHHGLLPASPNADLNAKTAAAILACLPAEMFEATGLPRSLWMMRIAKVAADTEGMLAELVESKAGDRPSLPFPASDRRFRR